MRRSQVFGTIGGILGGAGIVTLALCCCLVAGTSGEQPRVRLQWTTRIEGSPSGTGEPVAISGRVEGLAVPTDPRWLTMINAAGEKTWVRPLEGGSPQSPGVGDVDGDGSTEIIIPGQTGVVHCFSAAGRLRWQFSLTGTVPEFPGGNYCGRPRLADLNGDGRAEVLVGDHEGWLTCLDGGGSLLWRVLLPDSLHVAPCVHDVDGDGSPEVLIPCANGRFYCLAADGALKWVAGGADYHTWSTPIAADLKQDGSVAVLAVTGRGSVTALRGEDGAPLWTFRTEGTVRSGLAAADINGDGKLEVLVGSEGDRSLGYADLYCIDCTSNRLWGVRIEREAPVYLGINSPPVVLDLDRDGQPEIIVAPDLGTKLIIVSADGRVKDRVSLPGFVNGAVVLTRLGSEPGYKLAVNTAGGFCCLDTGVGSEAPSVPSAQAARPPRVPAVGAQAAQSAGATTRIAIAHPLEMADGWQKVALTAAPVQRAATLVATAVTPQKVRYGLIIHPQPGEPIAGDLRFEGLRDGDYTVRARLMTDGGKSLGEGASVAHIAPLSAAAAGVSRNLLHIKAYAHTLRSVNPGAARYLSRVCRELEARLETTPSTPARTERSQRARARGLWELAGEVSRLRSWADALARYQRSQAPLLFLAAQEHNPWARFDPLVAPGQPVSEIHYRCYQGEYHAIAINLSGFAHGDLKVRVRAADLAADGAPSAPRGGVTLSQVVAVPTLRGTEVWDALPPLEDGSVLTVPPWGKRQLWVTIQAPRGASGEYYSDLTLEAVDQPECTQTITVRVNVLPIARPATSPLMFGNWPSHGNQWLVNVWPPGTAARQRVLDDLLEHGINIHPQIPPPIAHFDDDGNLTGPLDFSVHDAEIKPLIGKGQFLFYGHGGHWALLGPEGQLGERTGGFYQSSGPEDVLTPAWNKAFREYLAQWTAHLKDLGLDYKDFALYPYDEAFADRFDSLLAVARMAKEVDPKVRIYCDLGGALPTREQLRRAIDEGLVDIWHPWQGHFEEQTADWLEELKATGKPVWMYKETNNMKELSPLGYYRRMAWLAWERGLTGIGIFEYIHVADPWLAPPWDSSEFCLIYPIPGGVASSKRWEAMREGVQDYEALWLLKQAIVRAKERGLDVTSAQRLLEEAPGSVLEAGVAYDALAGYRQRVVDATLALTETP
jgi:outer membrane protein assembly factor BamB